MTNFDELIFKKASKSNTNDLYVIKPVKNLKNKNLFYIQNDEKYNYIQHRLTTLQSNFLETMNIPEFKDVNYNSNTTFYIYGTITKISEQRLTNNTVYISSNIDNSNNMFVELVLDNLKYYSLFPGQIVALKGANHTGNKFVVQEINGVPGIDYNEIDFERAEPYITNYEKRDMKIGMINGPYIVNGQFIILDKILENSYDVLILCGPFFDKYDDKIENCDFKKLIVPKLEAWLRKSMTSKIIIIPNVDDLTTPGIFPQDPYNMPNQDRIFYFSNPTLFYINEILFGVSTFDILKHLSIEELSYENKSKSVLREDTYTSIFFSDNRKRRLIRHLIHQNSFLPVFPLNEGINYNDPKAFDMNLAPNFLITASTLDITDEYIEPTHLINIKSHNKIENTTMVELQIKRPSTNKNNFLNIKERTDIVFRRILN